MNDRNPADREQADRVHDIPGADHHRLRLSGGTELSYYTAGDPSRPAVLLLHGFPSSALTFRDVIPALAEVAYVIAPDLPGFGESDVLPTATFPALAEAVTELLDALEVRQRYVYLHDYGAPVGLQIAMSDPASVLGLIIQNANAHHTGFGPEWAATLESWEHPSEENTNAATAHLTHDGTRDQYIAGLPADVAEHISPAVWEQDWHVMQLPGRLDAQRALNADYANHAARFDEIAEYLARTQPRALLLWGRHDAFFDLAEVESWMRDLPRMEAHVFDAGHFLLETHAPEAAALMVDFLKAGDDSTA
ncbi:alpha/beta fold hydrolase [Microbacterium sp. MYb62]|uniref:alpha/beta fold hydrolase n=1 Tax=Microbacterium sp. MYb62 TaxID=1848690 RepID=UPI000CFC339E|nr:alpha/beta hydrolase [Microbacterium sp. MYb62]PRB14756.1 hydrolase [Microbacterium sp. MYb62]